MISFGTESPSHSTSPDIHFLPSQAFVWPLTVYGYRTCSMERQRSSTVKNYPILQYQFTSLLSKPITPSNRLSFTIKILENMKLHPCAENKSYLVRLRQSKLHVKQQYNSIFSIISAVIRRTISKVKGETAKTSLA